MSARPERLRVRRVESSWRPAGWRRKLTELIVLVALVAGVVRAVLGR
jgi:hypothetical protein